MTERLVLVAGATGGVGQLVTAKLLEKDLKARALVRNEAKASQMFSDRLEKIELVVGDLRDRASLVPAVAGITEIICCTGTTAFPSGKWDFANLFQASNTPKEVDGIGVANLVEVATEDLTRFVFVSSCGVERKASFPFKLLNAFGVLDAKIQGETAIKNSGLPYTIIRPARLIDGPYTSYDLNTLLQATTKGEKAVVLGTGDTLNGETSRIDVANACVECLEHDTTINKAFELINKGDRSEMPSWAELFAQI